MPTPEPPRKPSDGGYRHVARLALPLILSTSSATVMSFVDRVFLSWYSAAAVAAALGAGITAWTLMSPFMGTATYASTFVAQYYGADEKHRVSAAIWQGIFFSVISAAVLAAAGLFAGEIMSLADHPPEVEEAEAEYLRILLLGSGFVVAGAVLAGFFTGTGRTRAIMWVEVAGNALNILLDYALIFGRWGLPEWGIRGAAVATVAGWAFTAGLYATLMLTREYGRRYGLLRRPRIDRQIMARLVRYGFPNGLQWTVDMGGFAVFVWLVGRLGEAPLTALSVSFAINALAFLPMAGFSGATAILVGQYVGASRTKDAQRATRSAFVMTFVYMAAVAAAFFLVPEPFVRMFAPRENGEDFAEVLVLATALMRFIAFYSLFDSGNLVFASAIKGAGDTRFVLWMTLALSAAVLVAPTYLIVEVFGGGLYSAMAAATAYVIATAIGFYLRYRGGKWKGMRVIEHRAAGGRGLTEGPVVEP